MKFKASLPDFIFIHHHPPPTAVSLPYVSYFLYKKKKIKLNRSFELTFHQWTQPR